MGVAAVPGSSGARPLVSVVIPVFNRERYLREAIESTLAQDYRPLEVVVVDDGSTDGSAEIARGRSDVRLVSIPHRGVAAARNAGIEASSGELVAMLDSDDLMAPGRLALQASYLAAHPETSLLLGRQEVFFEAGVEMPVWMGDPRSQLDRPGVEDGGEELVAIHPMATMMVRRKIFDEVGPYDSRFDTGEDVDWFFRAREAGARIATINEVAILRRVHAGNLTAEHARVRLGAFRAFKARIDRRRARRSAADSD